MQSLHEPAAGLNEAENPGEAIEPRRAPRPPSTARTSPRATHEDVLGYITRRRGFVRAPAGRRR